MAIKGVDHIVVRVKDIEEGIATYRDKLVLELDRTADSDALGARQAFFQLPNGGFVELVAPLDSESAIGRSLESRGEGLHSLAMEVDDLEQTVKDLKQQGAQLIGADRPGPVFVHPRSAHGILVQLVERS